MNSKGKYCGIISMLAICVLVNLLMNGISQVFTIPDRINSMLCFRYLFLAAIAWIWLHKDAYNKFVIYCLALFSFGYLLYVMNGYDIKPFVYSGKWSSQNYPVYFWTYILIQALLVFYGKIKKYSLSDIFCWMGKNSWQIFVMQMFILGFLSLDACSIFTNRVINQILFVLIGFILSLLPVFFYQYIKGKCINEKFSDNTGSRGQQTYTS